MNELEPKKSIQQEVLKAIESGRVKMRPKWRFVLNAALIIAAVIAAALVFTYLASFIVFVLRQNGVWFVGPLGGEGARTFFLSLPWLLVALVILFGVLLEFLIRRYSFAYGRPLLYSSLGVVIFGVLAGILIGSSSLHEKLESASHGLPFAKPFYQQFDQSPGNVEIGSITQNTNFGYMLKDLGGQDITVFVEVQTQVPPGGPLRPGDGAVVLGDCNNGTVHAIAIRKLDKLPPAPPPDNDGDNN